MTTLLSGEEAVHAAPAVDGVPARAAELSKARPALPMPSAISPGPRARAGDDGSQVAHVHTGTIGVQISISHEPQTMPLGSNTASMLPVVLPILLLVVGGLLTHLLSHRREVRKECRSEVDACCKMAADLLDRGRTYKLSAASSPDSPQMSAQIRFDLYRLIRRVERLQANHAGFAAEDALDSLQESLTGGSFDSNSRIQLGRDAPELAAIEADTHGLIDKLEEGFSASFDGWGTLIPLPRWIS